MIMLQKTIDIWGNHAYQSNIDGFRPKMNIYVLDGSKARGAVLICPGGGYMSTSEREAEPIALQFNAAGFHAFVLHYSVAPDRHPMPLLDASRAMCIIRENADEWQINKDKIAVCGFSAGGHLAASLGVHWNKEYLKNHAGINENMNKPNAMILCYPVISSGKFAHKESLMNLLGQEIYEGVHKKILNEMSLEDQITSETVPTFLWHTFEDETVPVENSMLFASRLKANEVPFELHIYPKGPHGLSLATEETDCGIGVYPNVAEWMRLCTYWLKNLFKEV
jgi:acetyl esterase/lipase